MAGFFLVVGALFALAAAAYWRWSRNVAAEIAEGAEATWARMQAQEPELLAGVDRSTFDAIYARANAPRFPKYALACAAAFALALPATFAVLSGAAFLGERAGVFAPPAEIARYIPLDEVRSAADDGGRDERALYIAESFAGFYYYFGVVAVWLAIVAVAMRKFHLRRPGTLRDELIRAREASDDA
ncbi:MAG: hypothetical protein ACFB00_00360 [Parvularculaceae bacterium]